MDPEQDAGAAGAVYRCLFDAYGPQGWWPLLEVDGCNPTKTGACSGYHPGDYSYPRNADQRFEICLGAILTQNTAWPNVEKALLKLRSTIGLSPAQVLAAGDQDLEEAIRPSGYYRVKTRKLKEFSTFFTTLEGRTPRRDDLLNVWGVGPETADSILLYAYAQAEMVVDAYTRRILSTLGWVGPDIGYDRLKTFCQHGLPRDVMVYQEFHALLVEHAKRHYRRKPYRDPLLKTVSHRDPH